jgi:hypothetical protein
MLSLQIHSTQWNQKRRRATRFFRPFILLMARVPTAEAIGRVFQSSAPMHFAIVECLDVPGSSMRHFPP